MRFHFLHIGKTGGSAIKTALEPLGRADIVLHPHRITLAQIPQDGRAVFAVRHPVDRFVSAFYSRLRRGRPRYQGSWTEAEAQAFARYATARDLAEALEADDADDRARAQAAMGSIGHVRSFMSYWLESVPALEGRADRIALVLHQPELDADFGRLKGLLDAPSAVLPADALRRHANGPDFDTRLTPKARGALERWYAPDIALYDACLALRERLNTGLADAGERPREGPSGVSRRAFARPMRQTPTRRTPT